jgi:hypothetical protein
MNTRKSSFVSALVLSIAVGLIIPTAAIAKKPPKPTPTPPPPTFTSTIWVRTYANVNNGVKCEMTPQEVQATSDGGAILLAMSSGRDCDFVSWVVKLDAFGAPQWQEEIGCSGIPPGGFDLGLALRQTTDGGYVIAGGVRDCESNPVCTYLSSVQCGLVEKLDTNGNLVWKRVFAASPSTTSIEDIWQTSDGGFVAVGSFVDADWNIGALVLSLDSQGSARWMRKIGPAGRTHAYLNAVRQTADGGFVAVGEFYTVSTGLPTTSVLVVKLEANGSVLWQRGFNSFDASGTPTAGEHALSITATSDTGFAVAGNWGTKGPNACCEGSLLMKFDAQGNSEWQKAYSGGTVYVYGSPAGDVAIGGIAYSVHQTSDGGYVLAGAGDAVSGGGLSMAPWLAKTDAGGNLVWQHFYYGSGSSQYFASSDLATDGILALGFTVDPTDYKGELFAVRTDEGGLVGACSEIHPATPLDAIDPALTAVDPGLPVQAASALEGDLPLRTEATSISAGGTGC